MRIILLTGFSSGLGQALHHTLLINNRRDRLVFLGRKKQKNTQSASYLYADLSDKNYQWLNDTTWDCYAGDILLINNAGTVLPVGNLPDIACETMEQNIYINLLSPMKLIAILATVANKLKIINISSGAANAPIHYWASYCAAKAGMKSFLNTIELEENITVVHIDPGVLDTKMQEDIRRHASRYQELEYFVNLKLENKLRKTSEVADKIYRDYIE